MFSPTLAEQSLLAQLFDIADPKRLGIITGEAATQAFAGTRLPATILAEIWAIADSGENGFLTRQSAAVALRLIGHAQKGKLVVAGLVNTPGPLARIEDASRTDIPASSSSISPASLLPQATHQDKTKFLRLFANTGPVNGLISGDRARDIFLKSKLPHEKLGQIWSLADIHDRGALDSSDFAVAMYLIQACMVDSTLVLPNTLPSEIYEQIRGHQTPIVALISGGDTVLPLQSSDRGFPDLPLPTIAPINPFDLDNSTPVSPPGPKPFEKTALFEIDQLQRTRALRLGEGEKEVDAHRLMGSSPIAEKIEKRLQAIQIEETRQQAQTHSEAAKMVHTEPANSKHIGPSSTISYPVIPALTQVHLPSTLDVPKPLSTAAVINAKHSSHFNESNEIGSAVDRILKHNGQEIITFPGTSQYSQGSPSGCGIASLNCARLILGHERHQSIPAQQLAESLTHPSTMHEIVSICSEAQGLAHLELEALHALPLFKRSLELVATEFDSPKLKALVKMLVKMSEYDSEHGRRRSVAVAITRPPEIILCIKIAHPGADIYAVFDSHSRPDHPHGAAFICNTSVYTAAKYISELLHCDQSLTDHVESGWQELLLQSMSCHFFVCSDTDFSMPANVSQSMLYSNLEAAHLREELKENARVTTATVAELSLKIGSLEREIARLQDAQTELRNLNRFNHNQEPTRPPELTMHSSSSKDSVPLQQAGENSRAYTQRLRKYFETEVESAPEESKSISTHVSVVRDHPLDASQVVAHRPSEQRLPYRNMEGDIPIAQSTGINLKNSLEDTLEQELAARRFQRDESSLRSDFRSKQTVQPLVKVITMHFPSVENPPDDRDAIWNAAREHADEPRLTRNTINTEVDHFDPYINLSAPEHRSAGENDMAFSDQIEDRAKELPLLPGAFVEDNMELLRQLFLAHAADSKRPIERTDELPDALIQPHPIEENDSSLLAVMSEEPDSSLSSAARANSNEKERKKNKGKRRWTDKLLWLKHGKKSKYLQGSKSMPESPVNFWDDYESTQIAFRLQQDYDRAKLQFLLQLEQLSVIEQERDNGEDQQQQHHRVNQYLATDMQRGFYEEDDSLEREHEELEEWRQITFNCSICMEDLPIDDVAQISPCRHDFCRECIRTYIQSRIKEHRFPIICPICQTRTAEENAKMERTDGTPEEHGSEL